ncbi:isocitrate lyase/PEP mutase family protein [Nonomuraea sp. PA05]|uniref:isocitrate lyase/PEP mutase family protein n=1 Tax=Nonomuraea sp. PA05 TaxID=2604466 RepID=UPI0011DBD7F5|nr:isocitrate lyase/PEP mutase family protein [Nonomuraea sp. PA05]TYB53492.1 isocitrate lyase/PEP mutase family protein [Nonomuraea sp. PA05]
MTRHTTRLRQLIAAQEILVAPGAYDGTGARLVRELGFQAVYLSGFQTSAAVLGQPDVGYLTLTQMVARVAMFAEVSELPLIADADTGYGNPLNVRRTVRAYESAGAAALHLEDQTFPKRCGHMLGRHVIARTDARTTLGLDEAIDHGAAYHEAGADVLFVESPESEQEMRRVCDAFRGVVPVLSNQIEGGRTPLLNTRDLQDMGYSLALFSLGAGFAAAKGMRDYLRTLATRGDTSAMRPEMLDFDEFNTLIGLDEHSELERRYAVPD